LRPKQASVDNLRPYFPRVSALFGHCHHFFKKCVDSAALPPLYTPHQRRRCWVTPSNASAFVSLERTLVSRPSIGPGKFLSLKAGPHRKVALFDK